MNISVMLPFIYVLFYSMACIAAGLIITRFIKTDDKEEWGLTETFLIGSGILTMLWMPMALVAQFKFVFVRSIIAVLILLGFIIGWQVLIQMVRRVITSGLRELRLSKAWWALSCFLGLLFIFLGMKAITAHPFGDAEGFYAVVPRVMADSARLRPVVNSFNLYQYGMFAELHNAALLLLTHGNIYVTKSFTWIYAIALCSILWKICGDFGLGTKGRIIGLIMLLTSSTITAYTWNGGNYILTTAMGLAACRWVRISLLSVKRADFAIAGLFAGWAAVGHFANFPIIGAFSFFLAIFLWKKHMGDNDYRVGKAMAAGIFVMVLFFIVAVTPHLIKNTALFSEPFSPFVFLFTNAKRWHDPSLYDWKTSAFILATYPIGLSFGVYAAQGGNLSPLVLAFLAAYFLITPKEAVEKKGLFITTLSAVAAILCWMAVYPRYGVNPRYIMTALLLLVPAAAFAAENILENRRKHYRPLVVAVWIALFGGIFITVCSKNDGWNLNPLWTEYGNFKTFVSGRFDNCTFGRVHCKGMEALNGTTLPGRRVYLMAGFIFYTRADLIQCAQSFDEDKIFNMKKNRMDKLDYLLDRGFQTLVVQKNFPGLRSMMEELDLDHPPASVIAVKRYEDDYTVIYDFRRKDGKSSQIICQRLKPPAWDVCDSSGRKATAD